MKGIIMAGGQGNRLRPLTCNIPKPMMPLLGKPVIQYAIELLRDNHIKTIGITVNYLADEIINYFGNGSEFGVDIKYFIEEIPLGTAGSVKNAEEFLDETFVVVSGDAITDVNLIDALGYHKKKGGLATIILKEVEIPLEYGVVVTDGNGKITGFLEKPRWSEVFSNKVNTGIYIIEPQIFDYYEKNVKFDFSNDLFPILMENKSLLYGYNQDSYWRDIGSIGEFIKCNHDILNKKVNVKIFGEQIKEGVWIGSDCFLSPKVEIKAPVYIGDNTKVYGDAEVGPLTVIGRDNIICEKSSIKRSIIFNNCYISKNVEVRGALICNKVQLKNGVSVFQQATIGDESLIGTRSIVKPKVMIWPSKIIGNSEVVRGNLIWEGKYEKNFFDKNGISGEINVDITPEFISKLASAYGSILNPSSKVAVSSGDDNASRMFKSSLSTGLISIGIQVYDLFETTVQITRASTANFDFQGSIHVYADRNDLNLINIIFMDSDGVNITKYIMKKIENKFKGEDFRRVQGENFKSVISLNHCKEKYMKNILNNLDIPNIKKKNHKIIIATNSSIVKSIMIYMLNELKVNVVIHSHSSDIRGLSKDVKDTNSTLGIWISHEADSYIFVDEKGNIINEDKHEELKALVLLNLFKFNTIVSPANGSYSVEKLAQIYNAKFIRTKIEERNVMDEYIKNEQGKNKKYIINAYLSITDAISMSAFILNLITSLDITLSAFMEKVPKYHMKTLEIACPWEKKAKVMRNIMEEYNFGYIDFIEGVRLNYLECWALVLPDLDEPLCKVYTESENEEQAVKVLEELSRSIRRILKC
ncbi:sugar phosphate nucleotidyltransferase [Clostridium akagii]|uniref:sugar phosphate nucleotidyltransferase n=1 Tax=Clostridium akagii TaxID=91623 RepID=UPI0004795E54|nr:sugar phosphate nucleotidyltransferase [Clostridium akagii]